MGLFDKIKNVFTGQQTNPEAALFERIIETTYKQYAAKHNYFWSPDIHETAAWTDDVKNWPDKEKIRFVLYLVPVINKYLKGKKTWSSEDVDLRYNNVRHSYVQIIFRHKLNIDDEDAPLLYQVFVQNNDGHWAGIMNWPVGLLINQIEKQYKGQVLSTSMRNTLEQFKQSVGEANNRYDDKERIKMIDKIDALLFVQNESGIAIKPARFLGNDAFAEMANADIEQMPVEEKTYWYRLLPLAQKATGAKPSKKYLDETKAMLSEMGVEKFRKKMHQWLRFLIDLKEKEERHTHGSTYTYSTYEYLTSVNADAVKGLIWVCSHFHDNTTIQTIAALAERAFRKIPGKGPAAAAVGNACLYVLYKSKGLDGVGQLSRLRLRIKQGSTQALIDKYLQAAAEEQGVTVGEVEDMAVDDAGFEMGRREFQFDDYKAEIVIVAVGKTEIKWFKPDGSLQKSVPAFVKEKHAAKLKKLKDAAKQAEQTLTAQRDRIDRMFRDDRKISFSNFQQYYLQHGLMQFIANSIIWNFHKSNETVQAIHLNNYWVNAANEIVSIDDTVTVSLWHPVQATVNEIKTWREFLVLHQLQQPLKQAYREVYILTDAELNTRTYSNRMAAHILRQHQFNSLAKTRGWRYALMGAYDNGVENDKASLTLPQHQLRAEYWINEVNADDAYNDTGIWNYVSTDQVRFISTETNETVDLINIPPLVLSEVMRDVDLFVGVASVGNDPTWRDNGGLTVYRDYWTSYSFGELSEIAKNRKDILTNLVPRLKIRDVATIRDKFLVVKGKLRTYKIHIGSTNILMEPNDQYLCIVPDRTQKNHTENIFIPFEGDTGLSIILSKAFLLADDDKITDSTITTQINHK
jgi:hypothetical protein